MWPLPKIRNDWVSIVHTPYDISFGWMRRVKKKAAYVELVAHQRHVLENKDPAYLMPPNTTHIKSLITAFLAKHSLHDAYMSCSLSGPLIFEHIVDIATASPAITHFTHPALKKMAWDYHYLYPKDDAQYSFYLCGMERQHLFEYQLLAMRAHMNVIIMTSAYMAQLRLYKQVYGTAFRHSQLARDLMQHNNSFASFFTPEILRRSVHIPPALSSNAVDMPQLHTLLGLYLLGQDSYGYH